MTVGQVRSARRKMKYRYRNPKVRTAAEAIASERAYAAQQAARKVKKDGKK